MVGDPSAASDIWSCPAGVRFLQRLEEQAWREAYTWAGLVFGLRRAVPRLLGMTAGHPQTVDPLALRLRDPCWKEDKVRLWLSLPDRPCPRAVGCCQRRGPWAAALGLPP
ncbi:hypothetical protein NDU88_004811 [Pleurodeles waltl]|uniref:Uncharacterized protein n=1 Tax=Pleurodeles waltl TaxID=8319 RepID=A0AAV7VL03_PLEWA|nr:hypothetical protein NDU88_004811 [Pleurodeles waltl]